MLLCAMLDMEGLGRVVSSPGRAGLNAVQRFWGLGSLLTA